MEKLDVPQGTLDLMILTLLSREPMHGYGISQKLAALTRDTFQVNPGSLFPTLYRLEQDGKVKAEWAPTENNRNAKYYRLTAAGRKEVELNDRRSDEFVRQMLAQLPEKDCEALVDCMDRITGILRRVKL